MEVGIEIWVAFVAFIAVMLALDLFVFHRDAHEVGFREATIFSALWVSLGLAFGVVVLIWGGGQSGGEYFAGYLIEKALSVDNVFVFALIFTYFAVPAEYQHRVLFWGVIGALIMRAIFIALGAELLESFDFVVYLFGALLIATGVRMAMLRDHQVQPDRNPAVRLLRRLMPITREYEGQRFLIRAKKLPQERRPPGRALLGIWVGTPLVAVLVAVESADLIFAIDSIPAIFAITTNTFIVFSSNAFALLGLRALYFMLAGAMKRFVYLKLGLAVVLVFVGAKFIYGDLFGKVPIYISLPFIAAVVGVSIAASLIATRPGRQDAGPDQRGPGEPPTAGPERSGNGADPELSRTGPTNTGGKR